MDPTERKFAIGEMKLSWRERIPVFVIVAAAFIYSFFRTEIAEALGRQATTFDIVFVVATFVFLRLTSSRTKKKGLEYDWPVPTWIRIYCFTLLVIAAGYWLNRDFVSAQIGLELWKADMIGLVFFASNFGIIWKHIPLVVERQTSIGGDPPSAPDI